MMHPTPASVKNEGEASPSGRAFRLVAGWLGVTVHGLLGVLYLLSGLLAPFWVAVILWTAWTALLAVAIRKRRRRPILVALIPIISFLAWVAAQWAGSAFLDWAA